MLPEAVTGNRCHDSVGEYKFKSSGLSLRALYMRVWFATENQTLACKKRFKRFETFIIKVGINTAEMVEDKTASGIGPHNRLRI